VIGASLFSGRAEPAPRASSDAEKVSGALITSLSVGVSGSWRERWGPTGCARLPSTIAYAFGSEAWAISSQALWMHGPGVLSILQSLKLAGVPSAERALLVGLCCGIAIAVRLNNVLFVGPLLCWILIKDRRSFLWCTVPVLILGTLVAAYNYAMFGKPDRILPERFQRTPAPGIGWPVVQPGARHTGAMSHPDFFDGWRLSPSIWLLSSSKLAPQPFCRSNIRPACSTRPDR